VATVELLRAVVPSVSAAPILDAFAEAVRHAGDDLRETQAYEGRSDWLVLHGVGGRMHDAARRAHLQRGGHVLVWDFGYWDRAKVTGHMRMSIDRDHPQAWLDAVPLDASRPVPALREDADPDGHILLIGLGRKSRKYLNASDWERRAYADLVRRFPGRRIVFKPKGSDPLRLPCERADPETPIEELLRGSALVVCRHSNCAVDAVIAGVKFEAEDGAAMWLQRREFTPANRLEFLQRLAWWQYKPHEAALAWSFAKRVVNT
jgi:hypothetical protein